MGTLSVDKLLKTSTGAAEFTLPATDGTAGQVWQTDGAGQLSVGAYTIPADAVGTSQISALAVDTAEIAANAVDGSKIAMGSDAAGDILYYNGTDYVRLPKGTAAQQLAINSGATAPEWVTAAAGGKIGQVLQAQKTDTFSDSSSDYTDITDLSIAITPAATSSKILVMWSLVIGGPINQRLGTRTTRHDAGTSTTTNVGVADAASNRRLGSTVGQNLGSSMGNSHNFQWLDSPSSVAVLTYKAQAMCEAGNTIYINRTDADTDDNTYFRGVSTITVMEILA